MTKRSCATCDGSARLSSAPQRCRDGRARAVRWGDFSVLRTVVGVGEERRKWKRAARDGRKRSNGRDLGFEVALVAAVVKRWEDIDAGEYKHVGLDLIFLEYMCDAFEEVHVRLAQQDYVDREEREEHMVGNVFLALREACCSGLQANAEQPAIAKLIDHAMCAIEREGQALKGVLAKVCAGEA